MRTTVPREQPTRSFATTRWVSAIRAFLALIPKAIATLLLYGLFMIPAVIVVIIAGVIFEQAGPEENALFAFVFCLVFIVLVLAMYWSDMRPRNSEGKRVWNWRVAVSTLLAVGFVSLMTIAAREAVLTLLCIAFVIASGLAYCFIREYVD